MRILLNWLCMRAIVEVTNRQSNKRRVGPLATLFCCLIRTLNVFNQNTVLTGLSKGFKLAP